MKLDKRKVREAGRIAEQAIDKLNEVEAAQVIARLLSSAFGWGGSRRGHAYWREVEMELRILGGVYTVTEILDDPKVPGTRAPEPEAPSPASDPGRDPA